MVWAQAVWCNLAYKAVMQTPNQVKINIILHVAMWLEP